MIDSRYVRLLLVVGILAGCESPLERATKLVERGDTDRAGTLLRDHLADRRDDHQARLLLGRLLLKQNALADADQLFADVPAPPEARTPIADAYREAMHAQQDEEAIAAYAYRSVRWARPSAGRVCREMLTIADARRRAKAPYEKLLAIAHSFEGSCAPAIVETLRKWIRDVSAEEASSLIGKVPTLSEDQAREVAVMLRDEAGRVAGKEDARAIALLDLVRRVHPALGGDLETVVLRSQLSSNAGRVTMPASQQAVSNWLVELYRDGSPLQITLRVLRLVGDAITAYVIDVNRYPLGNDVFALRGPLVPEYLPDLPTTDGWGRPLVYAVMSNGGNARLISGGADLDISARSTNFQVSAAGIGPDIVWEAGRIVQQPMADDSRMPLPLRPRADRPE